MGCNIQFEVYQKLFYYNSSTAPMRELLKKDATWHWSTECEKSFNTVKQLLSSETVMSYFDSEKKTTVYVDASPVGIGAILVQDGRTIAYASRTLTSVESWYSHIERV